MELESVQSLLAEALLSLMKRRAWPDSPARRKWLADAADVLIQAQQRYRPSMEQALDLPGVVAYARRRFDVRAGLPGAQPLPVTGPIPLDAVADRAFTVDDLDRALFPRS